MANKFEIEVIVPEGLQAGDAFTVEVSMPAKERKARGQLNGLSLTEMDDEQLKRELINANSVLYKATQRGAAVETIAANKARVEAAKAEKASRGVVTTTAEPCTEEVYDAETANQI